MKITVKECHQRKALQSEWRLLTTYLYEVRRTTFVSFNYNISRVNVTEDRGPRGGTKWLTSRDYILENS